MVATIFSNKSTRLRGELSSGRVARLVDARRRASASFGRPRADAQSANNESSHSVDSRSEIPRPDDLRIGDPAAETAAITLRIARLVDQLGSQSYMLRNEASEKLAAIGGPTRIALEAAATADDPEVRLRAAELLRRLKVEDLWSPGHVSYQSRNESVGKVLAAIADQTGNFVFLGNQSVSLHDGLVDLDYPSADYWPTVDDICRHSGNGISLDSGISQGVLIVPASGRACPTAYAGPVRAEITEAMRSESAKIHYNSAKAERIDKLELTLAMHWEDRFRVTAAGVEPVVLEALTDDGKRLSAPAEANKAWRALGRQDRKLSAQVRLSRPSPQVKEIERLVVGWNLVAAGALDFATAGDRRSYRSGSSSAG